jgi:phosphoglucomutase
MKEYQRWLENADPETVKELKALEGNEEEIAYRFKSGLSFGTAGLRGIMMAGLNAMNVYTVARATKGLADYIHDLGAEEKGVIIGCDSRLNAEAFSKKAACVLAAYGIKVYIFDELRPTPMVSYGTRELGCIAGINITASHNPKEYNGYKVYFEDGAQISPQQADIISRYIENTDIFAGVKEVDFDEAVKNGQITIVGKEFDEKYLAKVQAEQVDPKIVPEMAKDLKVVYTPFHGAGYRLVPEVLRRTGLEGLYIVKEQALPDGSFPTVAAPNPENPEGFALGVKLAKELGSDLVVATDPDADRVGVMAKNKEGEFETISGNCMGGLLLDYILSAHSENGTMPPEPYAVKTIVSTDLAVEICKRFDVKLYQVLTGFKYIGEVIKNSEESGHGSYILGFEESYGYLKGSYARDKDAVVATMLIVEMAAYYKKKGMTLIDARQAMYEKYGFFAERTDNLVMKGFDGQEKMKALMAGIRQNPPKELGGMTVESVADYKAGTVTCIKCGKTEPTGLPTSDVLSFTLEGGNKVLVRPSGTEPKVKIYLLMNGKTAEEANAKLTACSESVKALV